MTFLLLYLQRNNEIINIDRISFINNIINSYNDIDHIIYLRDINKQIKKNINLSNFEYNIFFYNDTFFNFNNIINIISNYDYLIYFDDSINNLLYLNLYIKKAFKILRVENDIDQVFINKLTIDYWNSKINTVNIKYPIFNNIELDNYNIYERIKEIIQKKFTNPYKYFKSININYNNFLNKEYPIFNFRLLPSVIRCNKLLKNNYSLYNNNHFEYLYAKELEKLNFKSCYIRDICMNDNNDNYNNILYDNRSGNNITLVTAYIKLNIKRPSKRPSQKYNYIHKSRGTLSLNHNMIIYVSSELIEYITNFRTKMGLIHKTKIIEVSEENLYLYDKLDIIENNVKKNCPPYNEGKYVLAVNSRYNFVKDAIENNYLNTDYFGWIDFAAGHAVDIPKDMKITYSKHDKVRISWIARVNKKQFVYNHKCLGGGIFIGHKEIMLEFIRIHDIEFQKLMNMGYCINDDKLLFLIYEKYPYLIDTYFSSYSTMLTRINK